MAENKKKPIIKVPAIAVIYYKHIMKTDDPITVVPILWRHIVQVLLDATPVYRAKHPEIYNKPPYVKPSEPPKEPEGGGSASSGEERGDKSTESPQQGTPEGSVSP